MEKGDHDTTVDIVDLTSKEINGKAPLLADPVGSESTAVDIELTSKEEKGKAPLLAAAPVLTRGKRGKAPLLAASVFAPPAGIEAERTVKVGYRRGVAMFDLVLRLGALIAALTATIVMGTTDQTLPFFTQFFQFQASYDDLPAFTFFVIGNAVVTAYLVLSVPFSIVCIVRPHAAKPRLLLIICDTVMVTLITAAAASATAIVYLAHNGNSNANWLPICQQFNDFCGRLSGAVVSSFIAVLLFIFMIVFSGFAL